MLHAAKVEPLIPEHVALSFRILQDREVTEKQRPTDRSMGLCAFIADELVLHHEPLMPYPPIDRDFHQIHTLAIEHIQRHHLIDGSIVQAQPLLR